MKKTFKNSEHTGYELGDILVHKHIHDPESWYLTIRTISIIGIRLCDIKCTEPEIARYVNLQIIKCQFVLNDLEALIQPFT